MSPTTSVSTPGFRLKTVLIIDDDAHLTATLTLGLETSGYRVVSAPDATSGWKLAHIHLPDLILCDIDMPDKDGRRLLKEMQADPALAGRQYVLMTGKMALGGTRAAMSLGADDYLSKPFTLKELLNCIEARLRRAEISRRIDTRRVEELRERLHSTLPQQFFTPLASIMGLTELLQNQLEVLKQEEIRQDLADILRASRRLHRTLRNYLLLLELDSPEAARPSPPLQADAVMKALTTGIEIANERHQRAADLVSELEAAGIKADPMDLAILLEELVDNALAYSRHGTTVNVRSWVDAGQLHVSVKDRGRGMTPEQVARLYALRRPTRTPMGEPGLGLGLALVRRLVRHLGGEFHLDSEPGKGTTSHFTLPVATV